MPCVWYNIMSVICAEKCKLVKPGSWFSIMLHGKWFFTYIITCLDFSFSHPEVIVITI